jgi:antagonist of KipI
MSILIQKSGILSTIQDAGRNGFRRFGINPNGAMDKTAARLINVLLGNDESEAILEMHFPAPIVLFEESAIIALGGADFDAKIDEKPVENWRPVFVEKNQTLSFTQKVSGNRAYLSIKGGFEIEKWLASASTNLIAEIGGFEGRSLMKGDRLSFNSRFKIRDSKFKIQDSRFQIRDSRFTIHDSRFSYSISKSLVPLYSSFPTVRVIAGAEFEKLTALSERDFVKSTFTITNDSNRMGFRLNGTPLFTRDKLELVSTAVDFGTIQLLPDGQMIVLMADAQTSGGYPRIAHVVSNDLPILAQLGANDKVGFELISIEEAENLILNFERDLNWLRIGVNSKYAFER